MKTTIRWGYQTDVGMVRRVNQDAVMANGNVFVVADGMGGHQGGEVASDITTTYFAEMGEVTTVEQLEKAVVTANAKIRERGATQSNLDGMGTTVVAIAVLPPDEPGGPLHFAAANVGDSRLYLLEDGALRQVSVDHSLVEELVRAGQITAKEAEHHPQRNVVTRALGADRTVEVDTWVLRSQVGQRYLLCSDGLVNEVPNAEVIAVLQDTPSPKEAADKLVELANKAGGRDNTSVLIVDVVESG